MATILSLGAGAVLLAAGATTLLFQPNRGAAERIASEVLDGRPVDAVQLNATRAALRVSRDGSLVALAGWLSIDLARKAGFDTDEGQVWLQRAIADLRRGLSMAPANGLGWLRLAGAEYVLNGPAPAGGAAMRMAAYLVKGSDRTTGLVLSLGANYWPQLDAPQQERLRALMVANWKTPSRRHLLRTLVTSEAGVAALREAAPGDPDLEAWIADQQRGFAQEVERRSLKP